ncbi:hypothetical protein CSA56_15550 [candidate division KSB3 bacterium]|uniref:Uncharacterized protein n=1 Tax=candidate division KSB3 bacterium TaxID=2044937 RepID=A0A2G6KBS4_9BACT|nr:MAG: hypothetical protein CSA56_15550 [candidate division KSB3 bacterium]
MEFMGTHNMMKRYSSLISSGVLTLLVIGGVLLGVSAGVVSLGYLLFYVSKTLFHHDIMRVSHYVFVVLAIGCSAGLAIPILLLARNIQQSAESFSMLQFEDDGEDDGDLDEREFEESESNEELNEFLKNLHKTRNIGPFIPSPRTMDDLCPCGSGLKYKDCCGKFWS